MYRSVVRHLGFIGEQADKYLFFLAENISTIWNIGWILLFTHKVVSGMLFIHLPTEVYRGCFQVLAVMNKTAINISGQIHVCVVQCFGFEPFLYRYVVTSHCFNLHF